MDFHLPERQLAPLASLSAQTGRSSSELVIEAVDQMLAYQEWFDAQVRLGVEQIANGEFLEEDEMDSRFERMLKV